MENNLELYYSLILGNPAKGDLSDLERKFRAKERHFKETKDHTGFHLSVIQENGEIITAYNYLKTLWTLPLKKPSGLCHDRKPVLDEQTDSRFSIEILFKKLKLFTKSACIFVFVSSMFQLLVLSMGIPSAITESKTEESILEKAILEEELIRSFKKTQLHAFDFREEALIPKLVISNQPEIIKAARGCRAEKIRSILSDDRTLIHVTNSKYETPLHWAARRNCVDAAKVLLSYNANPYARDQAGKTPIDWAENSYNTRMTDLLRLKHNF
jgi:hypothetical protein